MTVTDVTSVTSVTPRLKLKPLHSASASASASTICIKTKLHTHQEQIISWAEKRTGGLIAAYMGSGKTLAAFGIIAHSPGRTLYVCPKPVMQHIKNQCLLHTNIKPLVYNSDNKYRFTPEMLENAQFIIVNYDMIRLASASSKLLSGFKYCFLDEAHIIRNEKTAIHKAVLNIRAERKFAMTGTPIYNERADARAIAAFCGVAPFNDRSWWATHNTDGGWAEWREQSLYLLDAAEFREQLPPLEITVHSDRKSVV